MARIKNALRKHYVAAIPTGSEEAKYLHLAKWITSITDGSEEEIVDEAYYDGDGTKESNVVAVAEKWTVEGTYDSEDPAQEFIAQRKRTLGDGRKVMHKIEYPDGTVIEGKATVTEIVIGGGEAGEHGEFKCTLSYNEIPTETKKA